MLSRRYRLDRPRVVRFIRALLDSDVVILGEADAVEDALAAYEAGGPGFADHLIGHLNARAGCSTTLTFDKAAARTDHFTAI